MDLAQARAEHQRAIERIRHAQYRAGNERPFHERFVALHDAVPRSWFGYRTGNGIWDTRDCFARVSVVFSGLDIAGWRVHVFDRNRRVSVEAVAPTVKKAYKLATAELRKGKKHE